MMNKEIINKVFEGITPSDELVNKVLSEDFGKRRPIRMQKKAASVFLAFTAAAALTVSVSAAVSFNILDFVSAVFPNRTSDRKTVESYMFDITSETEKSFANYNFSIGKVICDGNILITQYYVTKEDGSEFSEQNYDAFIINDALLSSDESMISFGGKTQCFLSNDKRTLAVNRTFSGLSRNICSGDELCIQITPAETPVEEPFVTFEEPSLTGSTLIKFVVPKIQAARSLEFKDENGITAFTAKLTPLSLSAVSDNLILTDAKYNDQLEADDNSIYPEFLDENMELTENIYNKNVYCKNSSGYEYICIPEIRIYRSANEAVIEFSENPEIEKAKYIKWFGCIAEISDTSETDE